MIQAQDLTDTVKGISAIGANEIVHQVPIGTGDAVTDGIKAGTQILIAIMTIIAIFRNHKKNK